jgi:hypothetical protein
MSSEAKDRISVAVLSELKDGPAPALVPRAKEVDPQRFRHVTLRGEGHVEYDSSVTAVGGFPDNTVITSKYTALSFLPLNLFEQFLNLANAYFLIIGILQIIPAISTTDGNPTMYQPLAFIVFVSALRAAKEDYEYGQHCTPLTHCCPHNAAHPRRAASCTAL